MEVLSREALKKMDYNTINKIGIPSIVLMENAGERIANKIKDEDNEFVIVVGVGNNGGDGLVIARKLMLSNKNIEIFIIGDIKRATDEFKINLNILNNISSNLNYISKSDEVEKLKKRITGNIVVVDALFGIGLNRTVEGIYKKVIEIMNCNNKIIAVDIPSGMDSDTGEALGVCVKAYKTMSIEAIKKGFIQNSAVDNIGEVSIINIDIPNEIKEEIDEKVYILPKEDYINIIPRRNKISHKGNFGKVGIVGGSETCIGAVYICSEAAIKTGSGLVTIVAKEKIANILRSKAIEAMVKGYDSTYKISGLENFNVIALGPGMGTENESVEVFEKIIKETRCPLVIDADGINILSKKDIYFEYIKGRAIITPHLGEMSRLIGKSIEEVEKNKIEISKKFARENKIVVLLKGYNTIITDGEEVIINKTGSSKMASGGMGDCLTGIITSFIGQGLSVKNAGILGAYIHGYAGDNLGKRMYSVSAREIINKLSEIIEELLCEK